MTNMRYGPPSVSILIRTHSQAVLTSFYKNDKPYVFFSQPDVQEGGGRPIQKQTEQ